MCKKLFILAFFFTYSCPKYMIHLGFIVNFSDRLKSTYQSEIWTVMRGKVIMRTHFGKCGKYKYSI